MFLNTDAKYIWLNGAFQPFNDTNIHLLSHTLHYGLGAFEGVRAYETETGGAIFRLRDHTERLFDAADKINITIPYSIEELEAVQKEAMTKNKLQEGYIRPIVFLGSESMGLRAKDLVSVNVAVACWEWGNYYGDAKMKGAKLDIAKWKRPSPETAPSQAKAAGLYMIATMSKHAAEAKGCSDAMMFDYRGYVAEATGANIFFVKDGEVHTPIADAFLNGITRQTVIGMLKEKGIAVNERIIMPDELADFEQCWLTGTAAEVTPVGQIGDFNFEVGSLTRDVSECYEKLVRV